jgi:hypothetical protein
MTVQELIQTLANYPGDARVVVQGYEGGYDAVSSVRSLMIRSNPDQAWYYGRFLEDAEGEEPAVLLFGRGRNR